MSFNMFAKLVFTAPGAEAKMKSLQSSFRGMKNSARLAGQGLNELSMAARSAAFAAAPVGLFAGAAINEAAKFEKQIQAVQSILRGTPEELDRVRNATKELGATTQFTSVQAARGAQLFAQAGFSVADTVSGLPAVLDAAAAGEIGVADAANLVASSIKAFGIEASQATSVADVFAETSALTNTTMSELGEGLKLSSAQARNLGLSLPQTAAALGVISNAGVKATLAGTALRNAFQKLSKPSSQAAKEFGDIGVQVTDSQGKLLPMSEVFTRLNQVIGENPSVLEKARKAIEIFGIRGNVAFGAFQNQASKSFLITEKNVDRLRAGLAASNSTLKETDIQVGKTIPNLIALDFLIQQSAGAAREMARVRLEGFLGQLTFLTSAFNNLQIELGDLVIEDLTAGLKTLTDITSATALAFGSLGDGVKKADTFAKLLEDGNQFAELFPKISEFAEGFASGIKEVSDTVKSVFKTIRDEFNSFMGTTGLTTEQIGKIAGKFIAWGAIAAPILAGLAAAMFVIVPLLFGIVGAVKTVAGTFGILFNAVKFFGVLFGGILKKIAFFLFINVSGPMLAVGAAIAAVIAIVFIFRDKFIAAAKEIWGFFQPTFAKIGDFIKEIFGGVSLDINSVWENVKSGAVAAWNGIKSVIGGVIDTALTIITGFSSVAASIFGAFVDIVIPIFKTIFEAGKVIFDEFKTVFSEVGVAFTDVGKAIGDVFTAMFGESGDEALSFKDIVMSISKFMGSFITGMIKFAGPGLIGFFKMAALAAVSVVKAIGGIIRIVASVVSAVANFVSEMATSFNERFGTLGTGLGRIFKDIIGFMAEIKTVFDAGAAEGGVFGGLKTAAMFVVDSVLDAFISLKDKIFNVMSQLFDKVKEKATSIGSGVVETVGGFFNNLPFIGDEPKKIPTSGRNDVKIVGDTGKDIQAGSKATESAMKANEEAKKTQQVITSEPVRTQTEKITQAVTDGKKQEITVKSTLECDGQVLARSVSKAQNENGERQGKAGDCGFAKRSLVERAPTGTGG